MFNIFKKKKKKICLDFDGVLNNYTGWEGQKNLNTPRPGVKSFLEKLNKANIEVIILTTRKPIKRVKKWFNVNNLPLPAKITNEKVKASIYIDDRAIKFNGSYEKLIEDITNFEVHWKDGKTFEKLLK
ncbi:hypothetical protein K8R66_03470 [bacterium]|nr:hypothetical protein [bacterium]